jgi:hypothetical protein
MFRGRVYGSISKGRLLQWLATFIHQWSSDLLYTSASIALVSFTKGMTQQVEWNII